MSVLSGFLFGACGKSCRRSLSRFLFVEMTMCLYTFKISYFLTFFRFSNNLYIHHNPDHCLHSRSLSVSVPPTNILCFPFWGCGPRGYLHTMVHQVFGGISASSPTKARHASLVREEIPTIGSSYRDSLCYSSWKTLLKTELVICYICARSLSPVGVCYLVGGSVFECLQVSRLSESSRLPLKYLSSSGPSFLPSSPI